MAKRCRGLGVLILTALGCQEPALDIRLYFEDAAVSARTSIIGLEAYSATAGMDCDEMLDHSPAELEKWRVNTVEIAVDDRDSAQLPNLPTEPTIFVARAYDSTGRVLRIGCTEAKIGPGVDVQTVIQLSCHESLRSCRDDDADGFTFDADCDDEDPLRHPGAPERCDRVDNDCDGERDESLTRECNAGPAGTRGIGECRAGEQTCTLGRWGECRNAIAPRPELCDGKDNNCNGVVDDHLTAPLCSVQQGVCSGARQTCAGSDGWLDCLTLDYAVWASGQGRSYHSSIDVCDEADNDCDGDTDEDRGDARGWTLQLAPTGGVRTTGLTDVWMGTGGDVWAIRRYLNATTPNNELLFHDGSDWTKVGEQAGNLYTVQGTPDGTIWLGGGRGASNSRKLRSYNSGTTQWTNWSAPSGSDRAAFWASDEDGVWLAQQNVMYHKLPDDDSFSPIGTALDGITLGSVTPKAMRGAAFDNIWLALQVGSSAGMFLHYDGLGWGVVPSSVSFAPSTLWIQPHATTNNSAPVWIFGENGSITQGTRDGGFVASPSPTTCPINAAWGNAPDDIWAVGGCTEGMVLHYNGNRWCDVSSHVFPHGYAAPGVITGISGRSAQELALVSSDGTLLTFNCPASCGCPSPAIPQVFSETGERGLFTKELIPVNPQKTYRISGRFRSTGATKSRFYFGLAPYRENGNLITSLDVGRRGSNGIVTAATDTRITVASALTGWAVPTARAHDRSLGFYFDGNTNKLPDAVVPYVEGKSQSTAPEDGAYQTASGTTITLSAPLSSAIRERIQWNTTVVRNHYAGSSYMYAASSGSYLENQWQTVESPPITGEAMDHQLYTAFRLGTRFVKLVILANYQQSNNEAMVFDDLKIVEDGKMPALYHLGGDYPDARNQILDGGGIPIDAIISDDPCAGP